MRHLTEFKTPLGLFQWKQLPFVMSSAPLYFLQVMLIITKASTVSNSFSTTLSCAAVQKQRTTNAQSSFVNGYTTTTCLSITRSRCFASPEFILSDTRFSLLEYGLLSLTSTRSSISKLRRPARRFAPCLERQTTTANSINISERSCNRLCPKPEKKTIFIWN